MIEVEDCNIWYKKTKKRKTKIFITIIIILTVITSIFIYYNKIVVKQISKICQDYVYISSTKAINNSIISTLSDTTNYSDFIIIEKNNNGDVSLMTTNSYKINQTTRTILQATQIQIENNLKKGVPISLFAFFGINILSGYGNTINYKSLSLSSANCEFSSKFVSVGINQTLHSIYIDLFVEVFLEAPFAKKLINTKTSVLICESVIVGKVPDTYLNGKLFG